MIIHYYTAEYTLQHLISQGILQEEFVAECPRASRFRESLSHKLQDFSLARNIRETQ